MSRSLPGRVRWLVLSGLALAGAGAWGWASRRDAAPALETLSFTQSPVRAAPAICPWRDPARDMAAFFPGTDGYHARTFVLSGLRVPIQRRLGPDAALDANVLYAFSIFRGKSPCGTILIQRAAGENGVIEVVVGVDGAGRVTGVRLQRLREPDVVARALDAPAWRGALRGKTAADPWRLGGDVPDVTSAARASAQTVIRTVRALLIEYDVARQHGPQG